MGVPDFLNYTKAQSDEAEKALKKALKWISYYNSTVGKVLKLRIPPEVIKALTGAKDAFSHAGKASGYAIYLRDLMAILNEIEQLPQPPPTDKAAKLYGKLLVQASVLVKSAPLFGMTGYGSTLEMFGKNLDKIADTLLGGSGIRASGMTLDQKFNGFSTTGQ